MSDINQNLPEEQTETTEVNQQTLNEVSTETTKTEEQKKSIRNNKGFVVFTVVLAASLICGLYNLIYTIANPNKGSIKTSLNAKNISFLKSEDSPTGIGSFTSDYIAIVDVKGTIETSNDSYNQKWLLSVIEELKKDTKNKALLLAIDSPGGAVYEADDFYLKLLEYKKETGRPIWAYCKSMAASGGYYIACAADYIIANRNTITGSIGVLYGPSVDLTGLMDKYGIKMTTFKAGKNKNMLNINQPLTEEQIEIMQSVVDEAYDQFTEIVAESRNIPIDKVKKIADGRIYTAKQALSNKLIDKIMGYEEAQTFMNTDLFGEYTVDFQYIEYQHKKSFYENLMTSKTPADKILSSIPQCPAGLSYFYAGGVQ